MKKNLKTNEIKFIEKEQKGKYVDGFVLVVPKKKLADYKKMAIDGAKTWMKYGALDYKECVIEDSKSQYGMLSFGKLASAKPSEVVIFSYILFKSRKHRDEVNAKVMKDPLMGGEAWKDKPMPFDMKRMTYGGFEVLVDGK